MGCDVSSLKECAKKKTLQEILKAQLNVTSELNFLPFAPVVDGYFLPGMSSLSGGETAFIKTRLLRAVSVVRRSVSVSSEFDCISKRE